MRLTRAEKNEIIANVKNQIETAQAVFVTDLIGISGTESVEIRKNIRDVGGKVFVTKNRLFELAGKNTNCESILTELKGTNALVFAFEDAASVAKAIKGATKINEIVTLKGALLGEKILSIKEVNELADLPSRDQMLATVLATFMAPISSFVRVLGLIQKDKEGQSA
jgi:large subunit ribosomal protein L10